MINCVSTSDDYYLVIFEKAKNFIDLFCSLGNVRIGYLKARVTPYMHSLVYHVPIFIKKYKNFKQFTGQGVEKNNDDAKKVYFQKSNKWDGAKDVLLLEHRQKQLQHHERQKRKYEKINETYWTEDIVESRKTRSRGEPREDNQPDSSNETQTNTFSTDYTKMTVNQLKQEIIARNLNNRGISKMKKNELIKLLMTSQLNNQGEN